MTNIFLRKVTIFISLKKRTFQYQYWIDSNLTFILNKPILKKYKHSYKKYLYSKEQIALSEYVELLNKCFHGDQEWDYSNFEDQVEEFIDDNDFVTWSCRYNGKLVGACTIYNETDLITLDLLLTHPDFQRHGIGINLVVKSLQEREDQPITLDVKSKNKAAIFLYKSLGFIKIKTSYIVVNKMSLCLNQSI